jgi:rRNA processing protein Krr1/Pno1
VKIQIDLAKAITALAKEYRVFQREDQVSCGVDAVLRSVQLGETSAQDAQRMLETAALARCATGGTEIPRASELFD